jgi:hypothetical protein
MDIEELKNQIRQDKNRLKVMEMEQELNKEKARLGIYNLNPPRKKDKINKLEDALTKIGEGNPMKKIKNIILGILYAVIIFLILKMLWGIVF